MRSDISNGVVAGLVGGLVFGVMMQMMNAPTPEGGQMPMMAMVAKVMRSDSIAAGWLYHLFNSAVIGAIFGWLLGSRSHTFGAGLGWGAAYGFVWWILGGLILMPIFLGMSAFASPHDGADATGGYGKFDGPPDLRPYPRRWLCYAEAGITRGNASA